MWPALGGHSVRAYPPVRAGNSGGLYGRSNTGLRSGEARMKQILVLLSKCIAAVSHNLVISKARKAMFYRCSIPHLQLAPATRKVKSLMATTVSSFDQYSRNRCGFRGMSDESVGLIGIIHLANISEVRAITIGQKDLARGFAPDDAPLSEAAFGAGLTVEVTPYFRGYLPYLYIALRRVFQLRRHLPAELPITSSGFGQMP